MCFSLQWLGQLLVWLIVVCAVVAVIRLLVPLAASWLPGGAVVVQIINIVLWAVVAIAVVWLVIDLLSCLLGAGGLSLGPPRPR
jgi:hypothetical protein